ncbi:hypothetical protein, partial [Endozoicomonas sp. ONNA2]|uniref:hypothetical protein n=1 Tax=Endozoicomonas sp. ONNA2 TaxID=2828741 RepID=UPI0021475678
GTTGFRRFQRLLKLRIQALIRYFYKEAFGGLWEDEIKEPFNKNRERLLNKAKGILVKSCFQKPEEKIIEAANTQAAILAIQSASNKLKASKETVINSVTEYLKFLNDELNKLKINKKKIINSYNESSKSSKNKISTVKSNNNAIENKKIELQKSLQTLLSETLQDSRNKCLQCNERLLEKFQKILDKFIGRARKKVTEQCEVTRESYVKMLTEKLKEEEERKSEERSEAITIASYTTIASALYTLGPPVFRSLLAKFLMFGPYLSLGPYVLGAISIFDIGRVALEYINNKSKPINGSDLNNIIPFVSLPAAHKFPQLIEKKLSSEINEANKSINHSIEELKNDIKNDSENLKRRLNDFNNKIKDIASLINMNNSHLLINFNTRNIDFNIKITEEIFNIHDYETFLGEIKIQQNEVKIPCVVQTKLVECTETYFQNNYTSIIDYVRRNNVAQSILDEIDTCERQLEECNKFINKDVQKNLGENKALITKLGKLDEDMDEHFRKCIKENEADITNITALKETLESIIKEKLKESDVEALHIGIV